LQIAAFSWARQLTDSGLANLLAQHQLLIAGGSALAIDKVQQAESRLLQILADYHQQHADQLGLGRARLRRMALPALDEALVFKMIDNLLHIGAISHTRGWLHLPEHALTFSTEE
ncbi:MAG: selenocysteinyl-tRNA-specific translation elongation factor SelB, partial [Serratia symbiotica]|nr:selenocysteinyl-tRNA-specific translation elongation factor SelB [Serratia symbiotica]